MSDARARSTLLLVGVVVAAAAITLWLTWRSGTGEAPVDAATPAVQTQPTLSPGRRASPPAAATPALTPSVSEAPSELSALDQRQFGKITRGLAPNPAGGVRVESQPPGSVASALHVDVGDVIMSMNGQPVASLDDFARVYQAQGLPRRMTVIHEGKEMHRH